MFQTLLHTDVTKPDDIAVLNGRRPTTIKFRILSVYKPNPIILGNNMESTLFSYHPHDIATLGNEINISDHSNHGWIASPFTE